MQISHRIFTIRYECFVAVLYLMKEGDIRRRLIVHDKAMQDHLKKPPRSDWPCEDYEPFDIALVKKHTLEKFKALYRTLPAEMKQKALPATPLTHKSYEDIIPRIGTLVSFGQYGINEEFAIDLIDQSTGELVRITGMMLETALLTSGAARNELIKIQITRQDTVMFSETQYNTHDGTKGESNAEQTITHFEITKLENNYVQQANISGKCRQETRIALHGRSESFYGSEPSHIEFLDGQRIETVEEQNNLAQDDVFRETG